MPDNAPIGPSVLPYNLPVIARQVVDSVLLNTHPLARSRNAGRAEVRDAAKKALHGLPSPAEEEWKVLILGLVDRAPDLAAGAGIIRLAHQTNETEFWNALRTAWGNVIEKLKSSAGE